MTPAEALEDVESGVRERAASSGLYPPTSGADGIRLAYVHALLARAAISPAIANRKVFVVGDAHQMVQGGSVEAANAFLKLLEEPPANTWMILTSSEPGALLPTILSRVVQVRVPRLADDDVTAFLRNETVRAELARQALPRDEATLLRMADGAPGALIGLAAGDEAMTSSQMILDAIDGDRSVGFRAAWAQGVAGARGVFTDTLDHLSVSLHRRAKEAAQRQDLAAAYRYSAAMSKVEEAKERAQDNVNPQLVTASLIRALRGSP